MPGSQRDDNFDAADKSLRLYLRALWDREFILRPCEQPLTQIRPYISELGIHLPRQYSAVQGQLAKDLYRAAAAHAAAHQVYSAKPFERQKLRPVQIAIIALLEDARVEHLAISAIPGLRRLWLQFFDARSYEGIGVESLLLRLSHALLDPDRDDDNPWVIKARRLYYASQQSGSNADSLREVGSLLGNDLGQMRVQFNAKSYTVEPLYRDDNLFLWDSEAPPQEMRIADLAPIPTEEASQSTPQFKPDSADDARYRARELAQADPDKQTNNEPERPTYPEWDQRTGHLRPHWCSITEQDLLEGDAQRLRSQLAQHAPLSKRLAQGLHARKIGQAVRLYKEDSGESFALDALIAARTALRCGQLPDWRVFHQRRLKKQDLSVLLLLDLSASTNAVLGEATVLALIREASMLLGAAISQSGDQFAIHGFRSNGRHEVNYLRFKEFNQPFDDTVLGRLDRVEGALSTRMGAAIRHAHTCLRDCRTAQQLILLVTDGEPHDIDVFHPGVLMHDAAHAVAHATAAGTPVFCVSVDPKADDYIRRIFGLHHYLVIENVEQLPQRLPELYLRLTA